MPLRALTLRALIFEPHTAFGQWWTETPKPPPAETVASHIAALAWMGLRHLPKRPVPVVRRRPRDGG